MSLTLISDKQSYYHHFYLKTLAGTTVFNLQHLEPLRYISSTAGIFKTVGRIENYNKDNNWWITGADDAGNASGIVAGLFIKPTDMVNYVRESVARIIMGKYIISVTDYLTTADTINLKYRNSFKEFEIPIKDPEPGDIVFWTSFAGEDFETEKHIIYPDHIKLAFVDINNIPEENYGLLMQAKYGKVIGIQDGKVFIKVEVI